MGHVYVFQSAEKYLKALLEELGIYVEKTHDLDRLLTPLDRKSVV